MTNVLYVCADRGIPLLGGKGASVHMRAVTSALHDLGHQVTLAVAALGTGNARPAVHRLERLDGDVEADTARLRGLIAAERIDVVIERYSLQSGAARAATSRHGLPLTLEVNAPLVAEATQFRGLADPAAQAWEHETFRAADHIHVVSAELLRYVRSVAPGVPARWIPNGANVAAFHEAAPLADPGLGGRLVVGFTGSMKPWHGVADLLDAFASVITARGGPMSMVPPVLLLVGDGPELDALKRRAAAPDLAGRVVFTGARPHDVIPALVRRFDIAVAPYQLMRGFYFHPLKVVEYLAAGVPVVYPEQGDLRVLVGTGGLGYPPGDVDALADRLARLIDDHLLRRDLAVAAGSRGADLDWRRVAERVLTLARSRADPLDRPPTGRPAQPASEVPGTAHEGAII
jgi:glycosyltransferase involved in cell wall biosynthesis